MGSFADRTSDIGVVVGEYDGRGAHGGQLRLPIVRLVDGTEVNAEVMWTKAYLYSHYEVAQLAWAKRRRGAHEGLVPRRHHSGRWCRGGRQEGEFSEALRFDDVGALSDCARPRGCACTDADG